LQENSLSFTNLKLQISVTLGLRFFLHYFNVHRLYHFFGFCNFVIIKTHK
jgi:hypothetical protein